MNRGMKIILLGLLLQFMGAGAMAAQPNILFILTDDQGWADFSETVDPNYPEAHCAYLETPNMNRFAHEGIRFTDAYSPAPNCTPTRRSIQYGMTPARQRGTEFIGEFDGVGHLSIAQYIKQANSAYRCALFGKWGEVMDGSWAQQNTKINPTALGYDESDGPTTGNHTGTYYHQSKGKEHFARNFRCEADENPKLTFSVTRRAIDFMARQADEENPFYLQVNYYAIHTAHQARQETMDTYAKKADPDRQLLPGVGPMLEDLDTAIGQLLQALDDLGLADNTYVILSSDNGGEQAYASLPPGSENLPGRNAPLRSTKAYLYEGGIRVPLMVRGPGLQKNVVCREPVALYDLLPTFHELAGGKDVLSAEIDGASLGPVLADPESGQVKRASKALFFHRPRFKKQSHSAIRMGDYKLVLSWTGPWEVGKQELFNLAEDIGETKNLAQKMPEKTKEMTDTLISYLRSIDAEVAE
ncbi:Choline-sulfatase [Pontiella desulfatans]|uniref:Choline-sulfatase n=2 Tax=Pontiella desulfatans TaxID=2750659 RepID=A0A6C2U6X7_PONDE|nr:sulfatase S1_16 [Kiritimatiellales bacterium]VGO15136.1 Choline-sulfatase [Pontiella desulfatans]